MFIYRAFLPTRPSLQPQEALFNKLFYIFNFSVLMFITLAFFYLIMMVIVVTEKNGSCLGTNESFLYNFFNLYLQFYNMLSSCNFLCH